MGQLIIADPTAKLQQLGLTSAAPAMHVPSFIGLMVAQPDWGSARLGVLPAGLRPAAE